MFVQNLKIRPKLALMKKTSLVHVVEDICGKVFIHSHCGVFVGVAVFVNALHIACLFVLK